MISDYAHLGVLHRFAGQVVGAHFDAGILAR